MTSTIRVRASSLAELFDCPARWEAKNLLGIRHPANGKALLGTAIHASTAVFDQALLDGQSVSVDDAAGALVDTLRQPREDVDWGDDRPADAEKIGLQLHSKYCTTIARAQQYAGVEIECPPLVLTDIGLTLTGTTDRIRKVGDEFGIADLKSGGRAVGADGRAVTAGHGLQLAVYELLAEYGTGNAMTLPAQIIGLQTAKSSPKIGTGEIPNARQALIGTEDEPGALNHAAEIIHSGRFYGNSKSVLCSAKFCPRYQSCKFRS